VSKPYDATFKALFRASPGDWPRLAGFQPDKVDIIDSDVSTVTAATDKVLRLGGDHPSLMHFEFQAGPDADLPGRVQCYNTLLRAQHRLPVHSVAVLLRRRANRLTINGTFEDRLPGSD
jgi:predicted transposase YdaD